MIQAIMFFALGLLTAGLLALAIAPAMWRRADRLARARIESTLPMSLGEIQAQKDHLRAEFAMASRRLEMKVERLEAGANDQLMEISRSRTEIARLEADRTVKTQTIEALEQRAAELVRDIEAAEARIAEARSELAARDTRLAEQTAQIKGLEAELAAAQVLGEEQKLELVARDTEIGNLNDSLAASRAAEAEMARARDSVREELEAGRTRLAAEQRRAEGLEARIAAFEAERVDRLATLDRRTAEVKALQAELAAEQVQREKLAGDIVLLETERTERLRELDRRSEEIETLKADLHAAMQGRTAAGAAEPPAAANDTDERAAEGDNIHKAIAAAEAEKEALASRLAALEEDHAALRAENAELRRTAEAASEAEREADRRLRDRLSEVAAAVVQMAGTGEARTPAPLNGEKGNGEKGNGEAAGRAAMPETPEATPVPRPEPPPAARPVEARTLAERIRALQHAAARH